MEPDQRRTIGHGHCPRLTVSGRPVQCAGCEDADSGHASRDYEAPTVHVGRFQKGKINRTPIAAKAAKLPFWSVRVNGLPIEGTVRNAA